MEDKISVEHSFVQHVSEKKFKRMSKMPQYCELLICDEDPPPEHRDRSGTIS
jgi:hypothetical protein